NAYSSWIGNWSDSKSTDEPVRRSSRLAHRDAERDNLWRQYVAERTGTLPAPRLPRSHTRAPIEPAPVVPAPVVPARRSLIVKLMIPSLRSVDFLANPEKEDERDRKSGDEEESEEEEENDEEENEEEENDEDEEDEEEMTLEEELEELRKVIIPHSERTSTIRGHSFLARLMDEVKREHPN